MVIDSAEPDKKKQKTDETESKDNCEDKPNEDEGTRVVHELAHSVAGEAQALQREEGVTADGTTGILTASRTGINSTCSSSCTYC